MAARTAGTDNNEEIMSFSTDVHKIILTCIAKALIPIDIGPFW